MNSVRTKQEEYLSILVIVLGFLGLFLIFKYSWMLWTAFGVGVLSLLIPIIRKVILKFWFGLAHVLGWINSRILLSIVFFLLLFPISLLYRLFNRNTLQLKRGETSLFHERNYSYQKKDLENMW